MQGSEGVSHRDGHLWDPGCGGWDVTGVDDANGARPLPYPQAGRGYERRVLRGRMWRGRIPVGPAPRPGCDVTARRSPVASGGRSRLAGPCGEYRDYLHNASLQGTHLHVPLTVPGGGGKHAGGLRCCHPFGGGGCLATSTLRVGPGPPTTCVCTWGPLPHMRTARAGPAEAQTVTRTHKHTHTAAENGVLQTRPSPLRGIRMTLRPSAASSAAHTLVRPRSAGWAR